MTLPRTLEPEVMDSTEDAREYDDMDHSEVNQQFVTDLLEFVQDQTPLASRLASDSGSLEESWIDVLDVGTGTAQIPIELCQRHHAFRVMAIDMAVSMLDLAVYNLEVASLAHRVQLAQVDAKSMGFETGMFDIVMSNSIVHHIPAPMACLEQMVRVVTDGGVVFVRDLMRPLDEPTLEGLVTQYAGDESDYCQRLFRESLHAALSLDEIRELVGQLGFDPETVVASSDRHWTWSAVAEF